MKTSIFEVKRDILLLITGGGTARCPVCGMPSLSLGAVSLEDQTEAVFCMDCEFRCAISLVVVKGGDRWKDQ
jgi:hypothetical protein